MRDSRRSTRSTPRSGPRSHGSTASQVSRTPSSPKTGRRSLFNQFHDLAAGSGIGVIYKDAQKDYDVVRWSTNEISNGALRTVNERVEHSGQWDSRHRLQPARLGALRRSQRACAGRQTSRNSFGCASHRDEYRPKHRRLRCTTSCAARARAGIQGRLARQQATPRRQRRAMSPRRRLATPSRSRAKPSASQ